MHAHPHTTRLTTHLIPLCLLFCLFDGRWASFIMHHGDECIYNITRLHQIPDSKVSGIGPTSAAQGILTHTHAREHTRLGVNQSTSVQILICRLLFSVLPHLWNSLTNVLQIQPVAGGEYAALRLCLCVLPCHLGVGNKSSVSHHLSDSTWHRAWHVFVTQVVHL